jgi:hypothetical protein
MPFAADASVCAALLRTGDRSLEPKAAHKWARKICKALQPQASTTTDDNKPDGENDAEVVANSRPNISTLSLISGIVALCGTSSSNSNGSVVSADGNSKSVDVKKKAILLFKTFDLMDKGVITETEVTILFNR